MRETQEVFSGYFYDHEVISLLKQEAVRDSTLHQRILESIEMREAISQMQEVERMATSSSQATISGIYSAVQELGNHKPPFQAISGNARHNISSSVESIQQESSQE